MKKALEKQYFMLNEGYNIENSLKPYIMGYRSQSNPSTVIDTYLSAT